MNIIDAIANLVNNPITKIVSTYKNKNRAKSSGDALEEYWNAIKPVFDYLTEQKNSVKNGANYLQKICKCTFLFYKHL